MLKIYVCYLNVSMGISTSFHVASEYQQGHEEKYVMERIQNNNQVTKT